MRRARHMLAVGALALTVFILSGPDSALANPCNDNEHQIFVHTNLDSPTWHGTTNEIYIRNADLSVCSGTVWSVRTAHLSSTLSTVHQAEAGWWEDYDSSGDKQWSSFTEGQVGSMSCGQRSYFATTEAHVGDFIKYRVKQDSGTDWMFLVNWSSGFTELSTGTSDNRCDVMFTHGVAEGEVSVRGDGATEAADSQRYLKKFDCSAACDWQAWSNTKSDGGNIAGWHPDCAGSDYFLVTTYNFNNC